MKTRLSSTLTGESKEPPTPPEPTTEQPPDTDVEQAAREYPVPGKVYMIHAGDSLAAIARAAKMFEQSITAAEILAANPGLDASRLRVGQTIMIPEATRNNAQSTPNPPTDPAPPQSPDSEPLPTPDIPP